MLTFLAALTFLCDLDLDCLDLEDFDLDFDFVVDSDSDADADTGEQLESSVVKGVAASV